LSYHYSVKKRRVPQKELKNNNEQIKKELIKFIGDKDGKSEELEKIIYDVIKQSDKKTSKDLFISKYLKKIVNNKFVKMFRRMK
jgi:hypothetical protein